MKKNMGKTDRIVRFLIAIVVAALYFADLIPGTLGIVLMVLAGVFVFTGMISFCPLYAPFKINTRSSKEK